MRPVFSHGLALTVGVLLGVVATSVLLGDRARPVEPRTPAVAEEVVPSDPDGDDDERRGRSRHPSAETPSVDVREAAAGAVPTPEPDVVPPAPGEAAAGTTDAATEETSSTPPPPRLGDLLARLERCVREPGFEDASAVAALIRDHHPEYEAPPGRVYELLESGDADLAGAAHALIETWGAGMVSAALAQEVRMLPADPSPTRVGFLEALLYEFAAQSDEPITSELDALLRHRSSRVRRLGVELLGGFEEGQFDPSLLMRPLEDPSPRVRATALMTASDWLDMHVEGVAPHMYRTAAQASIADPDGEVREAGAWLIASMGPAAADLAIEVLRAGAPESDLRHSLATAVASSPQAHLLLIGEPPESHVDAVLSVLADWEEDEEDPVASEAQRSHLVGLLPRVIVHVEDRDALAWLFNAAITLNAREFVVKVLHDSSATFEARSAAFGALVAIEAPATDLAPAFERFLSDYGDAPSNRRRVLEILRENVWINTPENRPLKEIVVRLSQDDPSPWVRDVAQEYLAEGFPEEE